MVEFAGGLSLNRKTDSIMTCRPLLVLATLFVIMLPMLSTRPATAQEDRRNAATWYRRALDEFSRLSESDLQLVIDYAADPQAPPSPETRRAISRASAALRLAQRGAEQSYSDFDLDYGQGFDLLLPHLSGLRNLSRAMSADAMMRLHDGDSHGAAQRLASGYQMSAHLSNDHILISSLVGDAMFRNSDSAVQIGLDQAGFNAGDSASLLRAMNSLGNHDPFAFIESVSGEQEIAIMWMNERFGNQEDRIRMADEMGWLTDNGSDAERLAAMTDDEFQDQMELYDRTMDRVVEAFTIEDREAGRALLDKITEEVENGERGFLAELILPSLGRVYDRMHDSQKQIDERIELLEKLTTGLTQPEDEANAALFYLQAIAKLEERPANDLIALRQLDEDPSVVLNPELLGVLDSSEPILKILRQGSKLQRCDFSFTRPRPHDLLNLYPPYAPGLHDLFRLLNADAVRLLRKGELETAVDRLDISFRMIAHFSGDEILISPLIAHHAFTRSLLITKDAMSLKNFSDTNRAALFNAVKRIPQRDPFGYIGSMVAMRKPISRKLFDSGRERDFRDLPMFDKVSRSWDGDRLLFLLVVFDTLTHTEDSASTEAAATRKRLGNLFSKGELDRARDLTSKVAPLIAQSELKLLAEMPSPAFARFVERKHKSRSDLRKAHRLLKPVVEPDSVESGSGSGGE